MLIGLALMAFATRTNYTTSSPSPTKFAAPSSPTAIISVTPQNITDLTKTVGSQITLNLTLSSSPSISAFGVWLQYDTSILSPVSPLSNTISYAGNILGPNAQVQSECVGASVLAGTGCGITPSPDVVNLALYNLGNQTTTVAGGLLYQVHFQVVGIGFARLHILQYVLSNGVKAEYYNALSTLDGFFTNKDCGASFCTKLHVNFTFSPSLPSTFTVVVFNATSSSDPNSGGSIVTYSWSWGEQTPCNGVATTQITNKTVFTHVFCSPQNFAVTLLATDSYGVTWSFTQVVAIQYVWVDVTHGGQIGIDHKFNVVPGTPITITADVVNNSTQPVPANVTLIVEDTHPLVKWTRSYNLTSRSSTGGSTASFTQVWNTSSDLPVQAYRIDFTISSNVPQNVTTDKTQFAYVQFIVPTATGSLSLSLLQSSGVGILVIIALVAGLSRFRKKPSWENEPLTQE